MAVTLEGTGYGTVAEATTSGNLQPGLPSGLQSGDILICFAYGADTCTFSIDSNPGTWTQICNENNGTSGTIGVWWLKYTSGSTAPTITVGGTRNVQSAFIAGPFRGCDATTPVHTSSYIADAGADTTYNFTSLSISTANCMIVELCGLHDNHAFSSWTSTAGAFTEVLDDANAGGDDCEVGFATYTWSSTGTFGGMSVSSAQADPAWCVAIALAPAITSISLGTVTESFAIAEPTTTPTLGLGPVSPSITETLNVVEPTTAPILGLGTVQVSATDSPVFTEPALTLTVAAGEAYVNPKLILSGVLTSYTEGVNLHEEVTYGTLGQLTMLVTEGTNYQEVAYIAPGTLLSVFTEGVAFQSEVTFTPGTLGLINTELASFGEVPTLSLSDLALSTTDGLNLEEVLALTLSQLALSITIGLNVEEVVDVGPSTVLAEVTDSFNVAEETPTIAISGVEVLNIPIVTEALDVAEEVIAQLSALSIAITEASAFADVTDVGLGTVLVSNTEGLAFQEELVAKLSSTLLSITEAASFSEEVVVRLGTLLISTSDPIVFSEVVTYSTLGALLLSVDEPLVFSDLPTLEVGAVLSLNIPVITETLEIVEAHTLRLGTILLSTITESLALAEVVTFVPGTLGLSSTESVAFSESLLLGLGTISPSITEGINFQEVDGVSLGGLILTTSDTASFTEVPTLSVTSFEAVPLTTAESLALQDSPSLKVGNLRLTSAESLNIVEVVIPPPAYRNPKLILSAVKATFAESLAFTEAVTFTKLNPWELFLLVTESLALQETTPSKYFFYPTGRRIVTADSVYHIVTTGYWQYDENFIVVVQNEDILNVVEYLAFEEVVTVYSATVGPVVGDTLTITEAVSVFTVHYELIIAETLAFTEAVTVSITSGILLAVLESLNLSESAVLNNLGIMLTETLQMVEPITIRTAIGDLKLSVADTVLLIEVLNELLGQAKLGPLTETLITTEAVSSLYITLQGPLVAVSETVIFSELAATKTKKQRRKVVWYEITTGMILWTEEEVSQPEWHEEC